MAKLGKKKAKTRKPHSWGRCTCYCDRYNNYSHDYGTGY